MAKRPLSDWSRAQKNLAKIWNNSSPVQRESWQDFLEQFTKQDPEFLDYLLALPQQQKALLKVLQAINVRNDTTKLLELILDTALDLLKAERGFILFENTHVARHFDKDNIANPSKISRSIANRVWESGKSLVTGNAQDDPELSSSTSVQEYQLLSVLCVPLWVGQEKAGVIYLDNRLAQGSFQNKDLQLLSFFAEQTAVVISNSRLQQKLQQSLHQSQQQNFHLSSQIVIKEQQVDFLRKSLASATSENYYDIFSTSPKMNKIFQLIEKIKDADLPVLISGESGTGKELIARAIHYASSKRSAHNFVAENCAAIAEGLFEAELFGYEKGAFTGAQQAKPGLFEQAHHGTLFLDEIAELPVNVQKKLLRTLAEKNIRRVGGRQTTAVDVRIITATNQDLKKLLAQNLFREDLFYRLNAITIEVPALRERKEDIPLLVEHFLAQIASMSGANKKSVSASLLQTLQNYHWPGNIRQLQNEIYRLAFLSDECLLADKLSPEITQSTPMPVAPKKIEKLQPLLHQTERQALTQALYSCQHNKSKAAKLLGISRFTLNRKLEKHGLTTTKKDAT